MSPPLCIEDLISDPIQTVNISSPFVTNSPGRSNSYRWFHGRGMAARDEQAPPVRFVGALTYIDESRRAEKQDIDLHRSLEERVRLRIAELETPLRERALLTCRCA